MKGNSGGFSNPSRPLVCEFMRMDTNEQIGCKVDSTRDVLVLNQEAIEYHFIPTEDLLANEKYEISLTTQAYSYPASPEGIPYPTVAGRYKVEMVTRVSGANKTQHMYMDCYGTSFKELSVTQYNYLAD